MSLISVIIPVYNVEKYIITTIKSCLSSDVKEIILIDDKYDDSAISLVSEYIDV